MALTISLIFLTMMLQTAEAAQTPHPRPDFERTEWHSLNGEWRFRWDPQDHGLKAGWQKAASTAYPLRIKVPFGWESELSGIGRKDYKGVAWYRREFQVPPGWQGKTIHLCFGAVDYHATVWVNDVQIGEHTGGYSEFRFNITQAIKQGETNVLVVRVEDHTDLRTPIGKQIPSWYTSTSGIWQTVRLETTGATFVSNFKILPVANDKHEPTGEMKLELAFMPAAGHEMVVEIRSPNRKFEAMQMRLPVGSTQAAFQFKVPNPKFWTPDSPTLYPIQITLKDGSGKVQDVVNTYFGIRTVAWGPYQGSKHSHILLNGKPIYIRGALDQSFNPAGIYTAPDDEFLKRDIERAKAAGFNMLRIHIKADEPRRLYWADKLGMLIQADIPCHYATTPDVQQPFEQGLREQIARDFNHPSIYCWTVFNEEWGINNLNNTPREHRVDWVERMYHLTQELDPTRLVQDNTGWSHLITDLNSFHWYSRDVDGFRRHYREINSRIGMGDEWNYIAGRKSRGEPFVNNEFGYVSAGNGDGDMSWGNLYAVDAMRSCDKMVGYTYTELTDIEWEHNGVYNYDRSPKEFGFDFWAKGMGIRDVFAEDFVVLDIPAIKRATFGEKVKVPVLFSHFSGKYAQGLQLRWQLRWIDRFGGWYEEKSVIAPCPATPAYHLTPIGDIAFNLPDEPCLATLVVEVLDIKGKRVHVNYTQWHVQTGQSLPHIEKVAPDSIALRFSPEDYAQSRFSGGKTPVKTVPGKHFGYGHGFVEYRLQIPEGLPLNQLESVRFICEIAAKAGREKVDWAQRVHPEDYPQTDGKKFPTTVDVRLNGVKMASWNLPDDPADARGVFSHWQGVDRGSYGYLREIKLSGTQLQVLKQAGKWVLRLEVPESRAGGIALYGERMGCYPVDPVLVLKFKSTLADRWSKNQAVAVERFIDRQKPVLPSAKQGGAQWRFTTSEPTSDWMQPGFDDSGWQEGKSGFGTQETPGAVVGTQWNTSRIWLRKTIEMPALNPTDEFLLEVHHDEDCDIYVNGKRLWREGGYLSEYKIILLTPEQRALFRAGTNLIAISCKQTLGGQFIDVGLTLVPE
jgi:hypothetical protein